MPHIGGQELSVAGRPLESDKVGINSRKLSASLAVSGSVTISDSGAERDQRSAASCRASDNRCIGDGRRPKVEPGGLLLGVHAARQLNPKATAPENL